VLREAFSLLVIGAVVAGCSSGATEGERPPVEGDAATASDASTEGRLSDAANDDAQDVKADASDASSGPPADAGLDADAGSDASTGVTCTTVNTWPNCSQHTTLETNVGFSLTTYIGDPQGAITSTSSGIDNLFDCSVWSYGAPCPEFLDSGGTHVTYVSNPNADPTWGTVARSGNVVTVKVDGARGTAAPGCLTPLWHVTCSGTTTLH
jgi:hypothetical protein